MITKLELLKCMAEAGVKIKNGKVHTTDIRKLLKQFKLEGTWADKFRQKTGTKKDSAELNWADKFRQKTGTKKDSAELNWADKFRQKTGTKEESANLAWSKNSKPIKEAPNELYWSKADADATEAPAEALIKKGDILRTQYGTIEDKPVTYITVKTLEVRDILGKHPQVVSVGEKDKGQEKEYWLAIPRGIQLKKFVDEASAPIAA